MTAHRVHRIITFGLAAFFVAAMPLHAGGGDLASDADGAVLRSYHSGNGLLQRGMFDLAAEEYRRFLDEHSDHPKAASARYGLAVCEFRRGRMDEARSELERLEGVNDFTYAAEVQTMLGQCRLALEQFADAAKCFDRVLKRHADHKLAADAAALLAEAEYRAGRFDESIRAARHFARKWPDHPSRERALFFEGLSVSAIGRPAEAAGAFESILASFPRGALVDQARLLAAQMHHRDGKIEPAKKRYEEVLARGESDQQADALYGLGLLQFQSGDYASAGQRLDQFLARFGDSPRAASAKLHRARAWFEIGDFDQAAGLLQDAAEADPALADEAAYWLAKCELRKGDFSAAAERLAAALDSNSDSRLRAEMRYDLGVALYRAGQYSDAANALSSFLERHSDHALAPEALHLSALARHQNGDYRKSATACEDFAERFRKNALAPAVAFLAAENLFLSGDLGRAVKRYREFLDTYKDSPDTAKAIYRLGMTYHRLGKLDDAAPLLEQTLRSPDAASFALAPAALGEIYFQRSEWKRAEDLLGRYIAANADAPALDDALLKYALALQRQEKYDAAMAGLDRLLADYAGSAHRLQALFEKAQCLAAVAKNDAAEELFKEVIERDEGSRFAAHALQHLGRIAQSRGDHELAASYFARAGKHLPKEAAAASRFAEAQSLLAAKQYADAEKLFRASLKSSKEDGRTAAIKAGLAIAVSRQDRTPEALKLLADIDFAALDPATRDALRYERAWCLRQLGKKDEAMTAYRELIDGEGPPNPHALLELAVMHDDTGHHDEAAKLYAKARDLATKGDASNLRDIAEQASYRLGVCEYERGNFESSAKLLGEFTKSYADSPLAASAHAICGESLFRLNRHGPAAEQFRFVIDGDEKDPGWPGALLRMGECQAALQRWARSEEVFARYLEKFPQSENWYQAAFGLAWAMENQGRLDDAIERYRKVVDAHQGPTAARAQFQIGECLFAKKKYEDAARELLKVDILYAYPEWSAAALYEAGRCFTKLSKHVEARQQFKQVAEKYGDSKWAALAAKHLQETVAGMPGH